MVAIPQDQEMNLSMIQEMVMTGQLLTAWVGMILNTHNNQINTFFPFFLFFKMINNTK